MPEENNMGLRYAGDVLYSFPGSKRIDKPKNKKRNADFPPTFRYRGPEGIVDYVPNSDGISAISLDELREAQLDSARSIDRTVEKRGREIDQTDVTIFRYPSEDAEGNVTNNYYPAFKGKIDFVLEGLDRIRELQFHKLRLGPRPDTKEIGYDVWNPVRESIAFDDQDVAGIIYNPGSNEQLNRVQNLIDGENPLEIIGEPIDRFYARQIVSTWKTIVESFLETGIRPYS